MSGQWIVTLVPPARPVPRGAAWGGRAAAWVLMRLGALRAVRTITGKLEAAGGYARGAWRRSRQHGASVPETLAEAAAREAAEVRQMAQWFDKTDPSFAADLYAAADRHERASLGS